MAYKKITDLHADVTITLGGLNKKLGKQNPTKVEGFFIGTKDIPDTKKKSGISTLYYFQTPKGVVGVWGKTDMDRKMKQATLGLMTLVTQTGMQDTPNGPMYKFEVAQDDSLATEVAQLATEEQEEVATTANFNEEDDADLYDDEQAVDEVPLERPKAPRAPVAASNAKDRALALLKTRKTL